METTDTIISDRILNILIVEDTPGDAYELVEDIKTYFPLSPTPLVAITIDKAASYLKSDFDVLICDICVAENEDDDIATHKGIDFMRFYRNMYPQKKIIAWSILMDKRIEDQLKAMEIDFIHKDGLSIEIISILKSIK